MKAFVTYLEKESPAMQRPSGSTGWIELPNGQRWNPGHAYKFNAHESARMKGGVILRFLPTKVRCLVGCIGGALWRLARNNKSADWNI